MTKTNQIIDSYNKEKEFFHKKIKKLINEDLKLLMNELPEWVETFSFTGFTPGFNDGEPCYFSVHSDDYYSCFINGHRLEGSNDHEPRENFNFYEKEIYVFNGQNKENIHYNEKYSKALNNLMKFCSSIPDEIWQDMGEGEFIIYRDGNINIEYYEHY